MTQTITPDDVLEVETGSSPQDHHAIAAQLARWAESDEVELTEGVEQASLLVTAAEHLGYAGDHQAQLELLERAEQADGEPMAEIAAYRVGALFGAGRAEEAVALSDEIRRNPSKNWFTCDLMAEHFQAQGDLKRSLRWCNIGLRILEDEEQTEMIEDLFELAVARRYGIRRELRMPQDSYDDEAEALRKLDEQGDEFEE